MPSDYYPPPESGGGWRWLRTAEEVRGDGGFDAERLQLACEHNARFDASSAVVIVRNGYLVAEWYENSALATTRYDVWSCTKSFTGTARPIGIESLVWDLQGVGQGFIGPHSNAHTGIHVSARELARFGYLMLQHGRWNGAQLVPAEWVSLATRASQPHNPGYGLTWWTNSEGTMWPGLPRDAFAAMGYMCNRL